MITTNHPSTADLIIPRESVQKVVTLLLTNNIPFTLTALNYLEHTLNHLEHTPKAVKHTERERQSAVTPAVISTRTNQKEVIIKSIYLKYIEGNPEITPPKDSQIADEFGIPLLTLKNGFKAVYGKTFYRLYTEKKMEYAKTLIMQGINASKVSRRIGYSSPIKFNKLFQKYFGMTPKQYQISHYR